MKRSLLLPILLAVAAALVIGCGGSGETGVVVTGSTATATGSTATGATATGSTATGSTATGSTATTGGAADITYSAPAGGFNGQTTPLTNPTSVILAPNGDAFNLTANFVDISNPTGVRGITVIGAVPQGTPAGTEYPVGDSTTGFVGSLSDGVGGNAWAFTSGTVRVVSRTSTGVSLQLVNVQAGPNDSTEAPGRGSVVLNGTISGSNP